MSNKEVKIEVETSVLNDENVLKVTMYYKCNAVAEKHLNKAEAVELLKTINAQINEL